MTHSYYGELRLEVSVPEQSELSRYFKGFLEFPIACPQCGLKRGDIKKNGFDRKHSDHPQLFICKCCRRSFYAHTSWVFTQLAKVEWQRILNSLFQERLSPKSVALRHNLAPSWISHILHHCQELVTQRINEIVRVRQQQENLPDLPVPLEDAIWWDEMFFRIKKTSWCLILLVNAHGHPLAWKFTKKRTKAIYLDLLHQLGPHLPPIPILIGDGWGAYPSVCHELGRECFLIQHLHTKPWEKTRLHHYQPDPINQLVTQTSLEIPYNAFKLNQPVTGFAMERQHPTSVPTQTSRERGRPKGSKDKKKRQSWGMKLPRSENKPLKKRGPKSLTQLGRRVQFHPTPFNGGWYLEWLDPPQKRSKFHNPPLTELELLLDVTYKVMKGGFIQSNRIEGINREVRTIIPNRGLKGSIQIQTYLNFHLHAWQGTPPSIAQINNVNLPLSHSTGFKRLGTFIVPSVRNVQIKMTRTPKEDEPRF